MPALTCITDVQRRFLLQINSYHRSICGDYKGNYKLRRITDLKIDKVSQSLIVTFSNCEIFKYGRHGEIIKLHNKKGI